MKVLVADDHPANRNLLRMMITALGHEVDLAEDGASACELTARASYDLLLLDLHMPGMSGLAVIEALRAREARPPRVVIITADVSPQSHRDCLAAGADDVQTKPIDVAKLILILAASEPTPRFCAKSR